MNKLNIVWTAVLATAFTIGALVNGLLDNQSMVLAWGFSAVTMAILASRENL